MLCGYGGRYLQARQTKRQRIARSTRPQGKRRIATVTTNPQEAECRADCRNAYSSDASIYRNGKGTNMTDIETVEAAAEELYNMVATLKRAHTTQLGDWTGEDEAHADYLRLLGLVESLHKIAAGMR